MFSYYQTTNMFPIFKNIFSVCEFSSNVYGTIIMIEDFEAQGCTIMTNAVLFAHFTGLQAEKKKILTTKKDFPTQIDDGRLYLDLDHIHMLKEKKKHEVPHNSGTPTLIWTCRLIYCK